ncbi:carboxypeptidase-like regulatory domain-containing protein [Proteiniphilum sp. UBA1028]|uniref:carboxypeptidase-like regulatory domain-containing protein n=1 Tax=Proteiniphilum sp. UBA1028 TaxID=1947251 RepID=UPI0025DD4A74|nr:carboxypeptidase-like regulatory domain-containing protein [Proteiniphilum sp. UBA1028]
MRSVLVFATSLLLSVTAFANAGNNHGEETTETKSVALVENVEALQLTGSVVDEKNNETLAGAAIVVDGKKYYSDLDGKFTITGVKPGKYALQVELISYEPVSMEVDLAGNQNLHISLLQK